ncbi:MAG: flagellar biosynthetic protein FliR [Roseinatronobacter sp.]
MMDILTMVFAWQDDISDLLTRGFGVFVRIAAMLALAPVFGEQVIPVRIRLAIALAFTFIVTPALLVDLPPAPTRPDTLLLMILSESCAGLALGIGLRLLVMALQTAGTIAAQATSLAQFFGGAGVDPQPAISQVLIVAALAIAASAGLHVALAELLILSYTIFPPGRFPDGEALAAWGLAQTVRAFWLAFVLATPFVVLSLLFYIALGAINKAMPQLMVAFVGAPAITWAGLAVLMLTAPLMLPVWHQTLQGFLVNPLGATP